MLGEDLAVAVNVSFHYISICAIKFEKDCRQFSCNIHDILSVCCGAAARQYVFITGTAIAQNNKLMLLSLDDTSVVNF